MFGVAAAALVVCKAAKSQEMNKGEKKVQTEYYEHVGEQKMGG